MSSPHAMTNQATSTQEAPSAVKRIGGIKVVVKRKSPNPMKGPASKATKNRGLPTSSIRRRSVVDDSSSAVLEIPIADPLEEDKFFHDDEMPCDTLMAIRSLEQASQCLFIPLHVGSIPSILESQLYHTLQSPTGEDSVVTKELQQLIESNQVRRLVHPDADDPMMALVETKHYVRAVWDAHRHYEGGADARVTTWFVSCLQYWVKRSISLNDLQERWKALPETSLTDSVDVLVHMQVLLPAVKSSNYVVWLPQWGQALQQLSKAHNKVLLQLKRSRYKEMSQSQLEKQSNPGLSSTFVLHSLVSQGLVETQQRPSGSFVRLAKLK